MIDKERFLKKIKVTPGPMPTPCWVWRKKTDRGYGRFDLDGKKARAHIVAYNMWVGPVPRGLVLDHLCRNRACSNPAHLEPVTTRVNILRGESHVADRARRTHCPAGHPYDEKNTYRDDLGRRYCRACRAQRAREKRKAA